MGGEAWGRWSDGKKPSIPLENVPLSPDSSSVCNGSRISPSPPYDRSFISEGCRTATDSHEICKT